MTTKKEIQEKWFVVAGKTQEHPIDFVLLEEMERLTAEQLDEFGKVLRDRKISCGEIIPIAGEIELSGTLDNSDKGPKP